MNVETPLYEQFLCFMLCGVFLGLGYEVLRSLRFCLPHGTIVTGIEDTIYLLLCSVILFGFSMEIGNGEFRLLYLVSACIGAAAYFLTLGRLVRWSFSLIVTFIKRILSLLFRPIRKLFVKIAHFLHLHFSKVYKILLDNAKNCINRLKNKRKILYNLSDSTAKGDVAVAGKPKIKAQVKKEQ